MRHTQKFIEQRKFLMTAPILVLPFLTLLFWALGGGEGQGIELKVDDPTGLNPELPMAHFSEEDLDKLSIYELARRDSLRMKEALDSDPYFQPNGLGSDMKELGDRSKPSKSNKFTDPNELMVTSKLDELYRELKRKPGELGASNIARKSASSNGEPELTATTRGAEMRQLNEMMEMMQSHRRSPGDPEEERINSMLDKILDVQHPERVKERVASSAKATESFAVDERPRKTTSAFYGLDEESLFSGDSSGAALEAVIHDSQELVAGSTVKLRLVNDVFVNGELLAKNQFIYGTAGIAGERLTIAITSLRNGRMLLPVKLDAYDLDGLEGIYIPGAITRDAAKQSSDQAIQGMQFMTMDQSLGAQAGAAGIQAAKGLFSKKVKLVRVRVKAGYKVLLRNQAMNR